MSAESSESHYDDTPGAKVESQETALQTREQYFAGLLEEWGSEIYAMLPSTVSQQKFMNSAIAAVRNNPGILECTKRSIYTALIQSAQDGLMPDGKEAVITPFKNKQGKKEAKYNPMTQGIRRRARELDRLIIDAQVVHEKDIYKRTQGDNPSIIHEPADHLPDRGLMFLCYAIFKREDGTILHREVMNRKQIMDVKGQSKQQDALMWTTFETEGWRKTVIRRGIKTVPCSEGLMQVVTRDDTDFAFENTREVEKPALVPPPAPKLEHTVAPTLDASAKKEPVLADVQTGNQAEPVTKAAQAVSDAAYSEFVMDSYDELNGCETESDVEAIRDRVLEDLKVGDRFAWTEKCAERAAEIFGSK